LHHQGRFLYGIRPVKILGGRQILELTGIGGALEPEDETYTAGVLREVREEIGAAPGLVRLIPCTETLVVRGPDQIERTRLRGPERPAALVLRHHRTPPHEPWHRAGADQGWLIVFLGELRGTPYPVDELPWLIWLAAEQVLATARADVPLGLLQAQGADLILGAAGPPPPGCWARLTDSQEALGVALGDELPALYRSLVR
jgi:8-oxo-dGTP pyrophosphatase MutT (NUDIX family)